MKINLTSYEFDAKANFAVEENSHIKMVRPRKISPEIRAYIRYKKNSSIKELVKETAVSRSHIYNIWKESTGGKREQEDLKSVGGRPSKLSVREKRQIVRLVKTLRGQEPNWTVKRMMARADVKDVSLRTVSRFLNQKGYNYLQARKKGLLSERDKKTRLKFAKQMLREHHFDVWTNKIAFYLDGVGFVYKRNPLDQSLAPRGRVWRTKSEGLIRGCTSKGQACGTGGKHVKMVVAISHGKGVVCAKKYESMNGRFFAKFLSENFNKMVEAAGKNSRVWIQDGDPSQNSKLAKEAMKQVNSQLLPIPPRSPDINPIENFFGIVKQALHRDALERQIKVETIEQFESRIKQIMNEVPTATIDKIIESMNKRMKMIIKCKGERIKY